MKRLALAKRHSCQTDGAIDVWKGSGGGGGFPGSRFVDLPTGNGAHVAPANGWFHILGSSTGANQWVVLRNLANGMELL